MTRIGSQVSSPRGTFCNRYGYLLGIRKSLPEAKHKGLGHYQDYTNWVAAVAGSDYDARGRYSYIAGEKAVFMNPACTREQIDAFIDHIRG